MTFALVGARTFDGTAFHDGNAVVVDGGRIAAVTAEADLAASIERRRIDGLLAPGFIDVQVNGGGGALFNDVRSVDGIRVIGEAHRRFGTTGFLPTFITDRRDRMVEAVAAAEAAFAGGMPGMLGLHLEGPFLNPERKGVHDPAFMRPIDEADVILMTSAKAGRMLLTLAPEMVPMPMISRLAAAGILLSAGHTAANHAVVVEAIAAGLTGFTHLFNAMPPLAGRAPGPVGAALDTRGAYAGLIVDLHHVSAASLRVAVAAKGAGRLMLVTDAMSSVGSDLQSFGLLGRTVTRADGRLTTEDGTLAGSDLDMASAVRNTVGHLRVPLGDALRMASLVPASFLGLDGELGRIAPGYRASLVLLDEALDVRATWIDGA